MEQNSNQRASSRLRRTDETAANIITKWLKEHFYTEANGISNYQYNNDLDLQYKGVDTEFDRNGHHYVCDEKAAVQYINKPLQTFAFELSFLDKGNSYHDGWLLDESKINDSFLCVWIDMAEGVYAPKDLTDAEQIKTVSVALVRRETIVNYLSSLGWTKDGLKSKTCKIRQNPTENRGDVYRYGCKFTYSQQLVEQPVNVLIHRRKLMEIADVARVINV